MIRTCSSFHRGSRTKRITDSSSACTASDVLLHMLRRVAMPPRRDCRLDELLELNKYGPTRDNLWKLTYFFVVRPQAVLQLVVNKPDGKEVEYAIIPKITPGKSITDLTSSIDLNNYIRE